MATAAGVGAGFYRFSAAIIKRSQGRSAVAASAYRMRGELMDERTGQVHDYTRHSNKPLFSGFYAPANAPEWATSADSFWNGVEAFEKRKDAQLARDILIDVPHQMKTEHLRYAMQDFIKEITRQGHAVQMDIHPAPEKGDERNLHVHLMVALRKIEGDSFGKKEQFKGRSPDTAMLEQWRERSAFHLNRQLDRFGYGLQVDHRSNAERGINREPTVHLGKAAAEMERRGCESERGNINREIETRNAERDRENQREIEDERHVLEELHKLYGPEIVLDDDRPEHVGAVERLRQAEQDEQRHLVKQDEGRRGVMAALWALTKTMGNSLSNAILGADRGHLMQGRTVQNDNRQQRPETYTGEVDKLREELGLQTPEQDVVRDRRAGGTTSSHRPPAVDPSHAREFVNRDGPAPYRAIMQEPPKVQPQFAREEIGRPTPQPQPQQNTSAPPKVDKRHARELTGREAEPESKPTPKINRRSLGRDYSKGREREYEPD